MVIVSLGKGRLLLPDLTENKVGKRASEGGGRGEMSESRDSGISVLLFLDATCGRSKMAGLLLSARYIH